MQNAKQFTVFSYLKILRSKTVVATSVLAVYGTVLAVAASVLAVYRSVLAVAASVLAVYSVCTSLIQHCISCISELLHYIVDDVEEILAKHVTF